MLTDRLHSIKKMSLHLRIFFMCALLLVASLAIACVFISRPTASLITEDYIRASRRDMAMIANATESTLNHLSNYAVSLSSDSRVISAAQRYPHGPENSAEIALLRASLGKNIRTIIGANADILMYDIFSVDGRQFGVGGYDMNRVTTLLPQEFFSEATRTLSTRITGPYNVQYPAANRQLPMFLVSKSIVDLDSHEVYGVLLMVVRENRFSSVFSRSITDSGASCSIIDSEMNIVSCTDAALLGLDMRKAYGLSDKNCRALTEGDDRFCFADYSGAQTLFMLSSPISSRTDWRILMTTSMNSTRATWIQMFKTILIIAVVTCLCLLATSYKLAQGISRPIYQMAHSIHDAAERGELQPLPNPSGGYEITTLYDSFNALIIRIRALIDHINQEQEEKSNYKFQLIQAQIKPHFLYNTLMTIKSLIDLDMKDAAGECIYAMSSFYRLSLNKGDDILMLGDEIELSAQYMYIQKLRYIDRLDYVFDVPSTLYDCLIPKMTIQPILENAIYHGIKKKAGKGVIEVVGRDLGDRMEFTISDNGNGIAPEDLKNLRVCLETERGDIPPKNASFGLYSVNRRIRFFYGEGHSLRIDSRQGEYTVVTLVLPKKLHRGGEPE